MNWETDLASWAEEQGLHCFGIVPLEVENDFNRLEQWLADGRNAGMRFMENHLVVRRKPALLLEGAKSAVVLGLGYDTGDLLESSGEPRVAQYARYDDYHRVLRRKAEGIAERWRKRLPGLKTRVVVDSVPLLERSLAARSPEGFIGKNTCFIHPRKGSWFLLGEILCDFEVPLTERRELPLERKTKAGGCGPCRQCQIACPTGALDTDYSIDSRRCLSYWTIEHRGPIPEEFWPHLARYVFGCDICQLACPYNIKREKTAPPDDFRPRALPDLFETAILDQAAYERYFGGSPLTRAKRGGLRRNALIALAVTRDPRLAEALERAKEDPEPPLPETLAQIERYLALPSA